MHASLVAADSWYSSCTERQVDIFVFHHFSIRFIKVHETLACVHKSALLYLASALACLWTLHKDGNSALVWYSSQPDPRTLTHSLRVNGGPRGQAAARQNTHPCCGVKGFCPQQPQAACLCMHLCAFGKEYNAASVSATWSVRDKSHLPVQYCWVQTECSHSPQANSNTCANTHKHIWQWHQGFPWLGGPIDFSFVTCFKLWIFSFHSKLKHHWRVWTDRWTQWGLFLVFPW